MNRGRARFPLGHIGQAVLLLGGVWLLIAPNWVGFSHQLPQSRVDHWVGAAVIVISVISFVLQWAFGLSDMVHRHRQDTDMD